MPATLPSGQALLDQLILGKPTGITVFFDNGTSTDVAVKVSDAPLVITTFPTWVLQNRIV